MTQSEKQALFLRNVATMILWAFSEHGHQLTGGELFRTQEQQDIYLKSGKSKVKHSIHQDRCAIDLNLFIDGKYMTDKESYKPLADYWRTLNPANKAGYDWGWDANHFEMS